MFFFGGEMWSKIFPILLVGIACDSDKGITRFNSTPEAAITSHFDDDTVLEGFVTTVRGSVSDPNHENQTLWQCFSLLP